MMHWLVALVIGWAICAALVALVLMTTGTLRRRR